MVEVKQELLALAEQVEGLTGPDRDFDTLILWYVDRRGFTVGYWNAASGMPRGLEQMPSKNGGLGWIGAQCAAPAYSASLDAAMTLVPEGLESLPLSFQVERFYLGNGITKCRAEVWDGLGIVSSLDTASDAASPALALTAACLKARALAGDPA